MTKLQCPMNVQGSKTKSQSNRGCCGAAMDEGKPRFDLEERTARFGESIIDFAKTVPVNLITTPLISQVVRSGTSVGANYGEADNASTKKDFKYRIRICQRESKETKHWLRMIARAEAQFKETARPLWQEAHELVLIFSATLRSRKDD